MNITPFEEAERSPFLWAGQNSEQNGDASQQAAQKEEQIQWGPANEIGPGSEHFLEPPIINIRMEYES